MTIKEDSIDHNALRLISNITSDTVHLTGDTQIEDHVRIMIIGYISGVNAMAKALKEALKC